MQNVQNADIQRVMNLVDLYRTKVSKESKAAKELADYYKTEYDNEIDFAYRLHEQGIDGYCLNIEIPENAVDAIRANEQLLGYFYKEVAGDDADSDVLSNFLAEKYDSTIFSEEDTSFLKSHFAEMVNYIVQTPNNDLQAVEGDDRNDIDLLPTEVLRLIKERVTISSSSKIYNPFTGFAQLACLFKDNSFYCEESYMAYFKRWNAYCDKVREAENIVESKVDENKLYAWMRVALYANNIDATLLVDGSIPQAYDAVLSYIPYIPSAIPTNAQSRTGYESSDTDMINKLLLAYKNLADSGKMVLVLPTEFLWEKKVLVSGDKTSYSLELGSLWEQLKADNSLAEIIQLPPVMGKNHYDKEGYCIIIAEKGYDGKDVTFIDARFASTKSDNKLFNQTLDIEALNNMIADGGKDPNTGLRKHVQIPRTLIDSDLLIPQVYVIEKPLESESPVPLSEICSLVTSRIYDVQENLPEDTPWVGSENLSDSFRGVLDIATLDTADCPNNPTGWSYGNRKLSNFLMGKNRYSERDIRISHYRNCQYIDGKSDAVLFKKTKDGISVGVIEATGRGIAISTDIHIMLPNDKIETLSLAALLRIPVVYRQIETYQKFGLYGPYGHLKDILVPTDKCIINDERHRLLLEQKTLMEQEKKIATQKIEYINEVRMRKHDMGQYLFELLNIEDLIRYYIENREKEKDFCEEIKKLLDNFKSSLGELSTLLNNLSKEEQFGEPEEFSLDNYLSQLVNRHKADGFKIIYERDVESIKRFNSLKQDTEDSVFEDDILDMEDSLSVDDIPDMEDSLSVDDILDMEDSLSVDDIPDMEDSLSVDDILDMEDSLSVDDILDMEDSLSVDDIPDMEDSLSVDDILDMEDSLSVDDIPDMEDSLSEDDILDMEDSLSVDDIPDMEDSLSVDDIPDMEDSLSIDDIIVLDSKKTKSTAGNNPQLIAKPISDSIPKLYIAKCDIQRAVNNIIDNARKHGFTGNKNNNNEIRIKLAINTEKNMFQIDFRNNGNPLPDGMDKMRYGLKGEKAGETGGTGIGGNYVKTFVDYYGGDYDVFMDNGWTVIRIFLPIR